MNLQYLAEKYPRSHRMLKHNWLQRDMVYPLFTTPTTEMQQCLVFDSYVGAEANSTQQFKTGSEEACDSRSKLLGHFNKTGCKSYSPDSLLIPTQTYIQIPLTLVYARTAKFGTV